MKTALVALLAALVVLIPFRVRAAQTSQRVPITPGTREEFRLGGGGVPSGYMIAAETKTSPPGYSFAGLSVTADPTSAVWTTAPSMLTSRTELGAAVVGGKIYAIGGRAQTYTAAVEEYDPAFGDWLPRAPMPTPRSRMAVVAVGDEIYAIGGSNGNSLATTEKFTPATNTWTLRAPMSAPRTFLAAAAVDGRIYAIGGSQDGINSLSTVEEFDPATNSWTPKQPMPTARGKLALVVLGGKILALGGWNDPTAIEAYDPVLDVWSVRSTVPGGYDWAVAVMDGRIYRFGGYGDPYATLEYNPDADVWSTRAPMLTSRQAFAAVSLGGVIYVIGGGAYPVPDRATVEVFNPGRPLYLHRRN